MIQQQDQEPANKINYRGIAAGRVPGLLLQTLGTTTSLTQIFKCRKHNQYNDDVNNQHIPSQNFPSQKKNTYNGIDKHIPMKH